MRQRCLLATLDLLCEKGYGATSTPDVAAQAGVSRGALTHHFPRKVDLVVAALEFAYDGVLAELGAVAAGEDKPGTKIAALLDALWEMAESPAFVAGFELIAAARTDGELRARFDPYMNRFNDGMQAWWAGLTNDLPADPVARAVVLDLTVSMIRGEAMRMRFDRSEPRDEAKKKAWRTFVYGQLGLI